VLQEVVADLEDAPDREREGGMREDDHLQRKPQHVRIEEGQGVLGT